MAKRGGFPGGMGMPGNMNNMLRQAQRMQRQMEEQQKLMAETEYTGTAGGGAVTVTLTGLKEMRKIKIDPEACDPEDVETLEELIMLAHKDASAKIEEAAGASQGAVGGFGF